MAIRFGTASLKKAFINNKEVKNISIGATIVWTSLASFTYTQGTVPSGVASFKCYRDTTTSSSGTIGELSDGDIIYEGDTLHFAVTGDTSHDASCSYTTVSSYEVHSDLNGVNTANITVSLKQFTITWSYRNAYDSWTTTTTSVYYGDTPAAPVTPSTVTNSANNARYVPGSWDDLSTVTGSRTITMQYSQQGYYSLSLTHCSRSSGSDAGWYTYGSTQSTNVTASSGYAFNSSGTTTSSCSATVPGTASASPGYGKLTVSCTYCSANYSTSWRSLGSYTVTFTPNSGYAYNSSGSGTDSKTVSVPGTASSKATYAKVNFNTSGGGSWTHSSLWLSTSQTMSKSGLSVVVNGSTVNTYTKPSSSTSYSSWSPQVGLSKPWLTTNGNSSIGIRNDNSYTVTAYTSPNIGSPSIGPHNSTTLSGSTNTSYSVYFYYAYTQYRNKTVTTYSGSISGTGSIYNRTVTGTATASTSTTQQSQSASATSPSTSIKTCLCADDIISLANNKTKKVCELTMQDLIAVYDFSKGCYSYQYPLVIKRGGYSEYKYRLNVEDGSYLDICGNHHDIYDPIKHKFIAYGEGGINNISDNDNYYVLKDNKALRISSIEKLLYNDYQYSVVTGGTMTAIANGMLVGLSHINFTDITEDNKWSDEFRNAVINKTSYDAFINKFSDCVASKYLAMGIHLDYALLVNKTGKLEQDYSFINGDCKYSGEKEKLANFIENNESVEIRQVSNDTVLLPEIKDNTKKYWYHQGNFKKYKPGEVAPLDYSSVFIAVED